MKVTFRKNKDGFYKARQKWDLTSFETKEIKKIRKHLIQQFGIKNLVIKIVVEYGYDQNNIKIKFTDPADEAFFLVWSNDGIEI